jgi:hypothetical protein
MGCNDTDKKYNCGQRINSRCVYYDLDIPECSDLSGESCVTVQDAMQNAYDMICSMDSGLDLSNLGNDCIDYEEADPGNIQVNEALKKHEQLICELQTAANNAPCPIDISCMNLDTSCLQDPCGTGFATLEDLLQAMINQICA